MMPLDPPLVPTPDDARGQLRRELSRPEYYDRGLVQRVLRWLSRAIGRSVDRAGETSPLVWAAIVLVAVVLLTGLILLVTRARRTARAATVRSDVLGASGLDARGLRARAEAALAGGRFADAVVDGFRALAVRQVESGRLDDAPGTTAHEVAVLLGRHHTGYAEELARAAARFDGVLYGGQAADAGLARGILDLDDALAAARPVAGAALAASAAAGGSLENSAPR